MSRSALVALVAVLCGAAVLWVAARDDDDRGYTYSEDPPAPPVSTDPGPGLNPAGRAPRPRTLHAEAAPPDAQAVERKKRMEALWARALGLHAMERDAQALALLEGALKTDAPFFEVPVRAKQLAAIRVGARRAAAVLEEGKSLEELVEEIRRWGNLRPLDDPDAVPALEKQLRHAAEQLAKLRDAKERERLARHLRRFLVPSASRAASAPVRRGRLDVDGLLHAVRAREAARREPTIPLPLDEPDAIEKRRIEQLELLRSRGALTLLDSLHAGLAWLALFQAPDGRLGDGAAAGRARVLYADDPIALESAVGGLRVSNTYDLSCTAMALMAFLDFRDQDTQGLFEPTIARATGWLRAQQAEHGLFDKVGRHYYSDAIALMALAQAAWATGDEELRAGVERGLKALYKVRGPQGGYRYEAKQAGDLSATGWVVQAVEYAEHAGAEIPPGMKHELTTFLRTVWVGNERFAYVVNNGRLNPRGRVALWPVGMLCGRILWEQIPPKVEAAWKTWSQMKGNRRWPGLYTLYYGVRMDVWLNKTLTTRWHGWLHELSTHQVRTGPLAGAYPYKLDHWIGRAGTTLTTALALLAGQHALFLR